MSIYSISSCFGLSFVMFLFQVTSHSANYLRQLIENGADIYPGANMAQDADGAVYDLSIMSKTQRQGKARLLLANEIPGSAPKIVYRHVRDGDVVLMNRQPTLHRASMMCHFVRVLKVRVTETGRGREKHDTTLFLISYPLLISYLLFFLCTGLEDVSFNVCQLWFVQCRF